MRSEARGAGHVFITTTSPIVGRGIFFSLNWPTLERGEIGNRSPEADGCWMLASRTEGWNRGTRPRRARCPPGLTAKNAGTPLTPFQIQNPNVWAARSPPPTLSMASTVVEHSPLFNSLQSHVAPSHDSLLLRRPIGHPSRRMQPAFRGRRRAVSRCGRACDGSYRSTPSEHSG